MDKYQLQEKLGEGSYGSVHKGLNKENGQVVAIKVITIEETEDTSLKDEIELLSKCKHKNIVQYFSSHIFDDRVWIVMDYCGVGSVRDIMDTTQRTLSENQISFIIANTLDGIVYLHKQGIIHRDIKAGNILLNDEGDVKIADFGISKQLGSTISKRNTVIGTPLWMAPEVIRGTPYDNSVDVWSLGITAIELADGEPPFADCHTMRALFKIPLSPPPTVADPSEFSEEFNDFISKCCVKEPAERPKASQLLKHPFVEYGRTQKNVIVNLIDIFREEQRKPKQPSESSNTSDTIRNGGDFSTIVQHSTGSGNWDTAVQHGTSSSSFGTAIFSGTTEFHDDDDDGGNSYGTTEFRGEDKPTSNSNSNYLAALSKARQSNPEAKKTKTKSFRRSVNPAALKNLEFLQEKSKWSDINRGSSDLKVFITKPTKDVGVQTEDPKRSSSGLLKFKKKKSLG